MTVSDEIGFPNVVKPVMSSSGKGQSVEKAWNYAIANSRGCIPVLQKNDQ